MRWDTWMLSLQAHQQQMSNVDFPSLTHNTQPHNMNPSSGCLAYTGGKWGNLNRISKLPWNSWFDLRLVFSFVHIAVLTHSVMRLEVGKTVSTKVVISSKYSLLSFLSPAPGNLKLSKLDLFIDLVEWLLIKCSPSWVSVFSSRRLWLCSKSLFEQRQSWFW